MHVTAARTTSTAAALLTKGDQQVLTIPDDLASEPLLEALNELLAGYRLVPLTEPEG